MSRMRVYSDLRFDGLNESDLGRLIHCVEWFFIEI